MRKSLLAIALMSALAPAASAMADPPPWAPAHGRRAKQAAMYDNYGRYREPRPISYDDHVWRGDDGRYYCRRSNGTTGLVIGAALGGLVGHELAGGRDRTLGAVLGATAGGLIGREIDRGRLRCR